MKPHILFLCTGNSARSVLAEATLRAWASDRFEASSAGSQPVGLVHPLALAQLASEGISSEGLRSKSWDEFAAAGAPRIDVLVTVCDSAAAETCPLAFGDFLRTHWGLPDPAAASGSEELRRGAFADAHALIQTRLRALLQLPPALWSEPAALKLALDEIGKISAAGGGHR